MVPEEVHAKKRRGRGRPPKEVEGKNRRRRCPPKDVDGKKRGRGRPPKNVDGKKRGRGRPPSWRRSIHRPQSATTAMKRRSFYKIIMPSATHENMLMLPPKFTRRFKGQFSTVSVLTVPTGKTWNIKLHEEDDCFWFGAGWREFQEYYSIHFGSFLLFKYEGNSNFRVHIFDVNACEIHYKCSSPQVKSLGICPPKQSASSKPCKQEKGHHIFGAHKILNMSSSFLRDVVMNTKDGGPDDDGSDGVSCEILDELPYMSDVEVVDLASEDESQELNEERRISTEDDARKLNQEIRMTSTEDEAHELNQEIRMTSIEDEVSELNSEIRMINTEHEAHKLNQERTDSTIACNNHARFTSKEGTCRFRMENSETPDSPKQNGCELNAKDETLEMIQRKEKESCAAAAEAYIRNCENPSFMVAMKLYNLVDSRGAYLPASFSRKYLGGLPNYIQLEEAIDGRRWTVKCCCVRDRITNVGDGWRAFTKGNKLEKGDVCVFELINRTEIVLKVSVFRNHQRQQ